MDLAEIRKKAKVKSTAGQVGAQPKLESPALPDPAVAIEPPLVNDQLVEPAAGPAVVVEPEVEPATTAFDALDELFSGVADIDLATEESYLQGLQDRELANAAEKQRWLTFGLGREHYAVNIRYVRELIKPREITDIPRVPNFILGIISLRGIIVPIFDLRRRLKLEAADIDLNTRIVVCEQGDRIAGLLVDNITQVVKFSEEEIEPPPAVLSGLDRELVEGVGRVQGRMIILLDLPSVLDAELN